MAWTADHLGPPGLHINEMARRLGARKSTLRAQLLRLVAHGMVREFVDGSDAWMVCGDEFSAAAAYGLLGATHEQRTKHARERESDRVGLILNCALPGHSVLEVDGSLIDAATGEVLVNLDGSRPSVDNAAPTSVPDQVALRVDAAGNPSNQDIEALEQLLVHLGGLVTTDANGGRIVAPPERNLNAIVGNRNHAARRVVEAFGWRWV